MLVAVGSAVLGCKRARRGKTLPSGTIVVIVEPRSQLEPPSYRVQGLKAPADRCLEALADMLRKGDVDRIVLESQEKRTFPDIEEFEERVRALANSYKVEVDYRPCVSDIDMDEVPPELLE